MTNKIEVCIIDDDDVDCMIAKVLLERSNHFKASSFYRANDALDCFTYSMKNNQFKALPKVIFLDLDMPLRDGWDFLEAYSLLIKESRQPLPTIYILSCSIYPPDYQRAMSHPLVKDMLVKPLSQQAIEEVLSTHLLSTASASC